MCTLYDTNYYEIDETDYVLYKSGEYVEDPFTYNNIQKENAIEIQNKIYDVVNIYTWVFKCNKKQSIYRIPLKIDDINRIENKYILLSSKKNIRPNQITYNKEENAIKFAHNIKKDDIIILKDNTQLKSLSWYFADHYYYYVYGYTGSTIHDGNCLINLCDIIGYNIL